MSRGAAVAVLLALGAAAPAGAQIDARMLRHPAVSRTQVAFVYAGDVWLVPKAGGVAHRLSTPAGEEAFPRFSPDGSRLAYSADYDGNTDVYVIAAAGGLPTRVTHHPAADRVLGWYPDGKSLLFATSMTAGKDRFNQLYRVSVEGGLPEKLPLPYGEFGTIAADGRRLAYMPSTRDFRTWKRYRGGWAPDIWLFDLRDQTAKNLTHDPANDSQPMWHGDTLYFLSDRDASKRHNVWALDVRTGATRQVTRFEEYDVRFPSIGPDDLVFENGDRLYRMALPAEAVSEVAVQVVTDRATLRPRAEKVAKLIANPGISPSGRRAIVEARGAVLTLPAEHGVVLNLNPSSGVAARYPAWSPDGKTVAYWSDRSGEYELTLRAADGSGEERKLTTLGPGFRYRIFWSPDSKQVAFADNKMRINVCDVASGQVTSIDKANYFFQGNLQSFRASWSADSRWLAYARDLENGQSAVVLYDTKSAARHQVTSGFYNDAAPVFDPGGRYLFLLTNRSFKPIYSDLDNTWIYANTTQVAAVPLRKDVPSPLAARNDVEGQVEKKDGEDDDAKGDAKAKHAEAKDAKKAADGKAGDEPPKPVEIDLAGFEERLVVLPPAAGNYGRLAAIAGKVLYQRGPRTGAADEVNPLVFFDLEEREEKTVVADVDGFEVSADEKKLLVWKKEKYAIVEPKADQKLEKTLATADLEVTVDPVAEWRQLFSDAWRFERDYFYDPAMHGVDWNSMRERYGRLLDDAVTRFDVNFVIGELIAELNASHTYRGGGDLEKGKERGVGMLGVDFALENGAYRIKKILRGAPWDSEARSPLDRSGVDVKEGDYLLAVDRVPLDVRKDPWAAFQGKSGKAVLLTVNGQPTPSGAREVLVETLASEDRLRNLAWIDEKRQRVDVATKGRVAYVYVPDTGQNGQSELVRQFMGQFRKDGLIVDERFNSGGQIPDRFVELLNRPLYNYWAVRDGKDWQWPPVAQVGPKVMLINGWSGSGGDALPLYFKQAGLGPLIGTRTWGGLIGNSGVPPLVDGGGVTVPTFGIYGTDGKWIVEGRGVEPDIEVIDDPSLMQDGGDPQLDRAIQEVMRRLDGAKPRDPAKPAYPDRSGR
ncbi:MAG: PDZ domain-containing protein [Vicinamibacteria bacterium]